MSATAVPSFSTAKTIVFEAASEWVNDKAPRLGAALAYYAIFSIAPLLVIAIAIAGMVLGEEAAQGQISAQVQNLVGAQGGEAVETMVQSANKPGAGTIGSVLGIAMLLFGAAGLFGQLQDALNTIWEVQPKPGRGAWGFVRDRFLSLTMVLGVAFLLLVSLVVSSVLAAVGTLLGDWQTGTVGLIVTTTLDVVVVTVLFALIYKFLPDAVIAWRDVWFGAAVTAVMFSLGKFLIGLYLGRAGVGSAYGAAGSLAVLLVWLYYASQIFLFGAELTKAYANHLGSRIKPKPYAEPVTPAARAEQGLPATA
ncbi:Ribonuclease BN OS=Gloeocapsa sp. PCC 7428 GN=Glo7428_4543 PE=4 SV=1: Virul_fac_BrkB [Gemmataceae bacterium]|nr:Ribonuclease BN OS=Gloeocapsa sp. PCC 7428 GN=Glo7428_4543 PE=4 SV=1: Virul_fac_BrkB [Gemmataceae bacterium]VTT96863.1 Ribonuclease BN OS=Gloeocapsa sp. PCC 7428 GN=Glo7428_4543 PE=4 SV=1: Virul_fac_BrkB [Gemmataceae bacterium]